MKILILANGTLAFYKFRKELVEALCSKGYEVTLLSPDDGLAERLIAVGARLILIKLNRRGINPFQELGLFLKYLWVIFLNKPDCVLTYTIKPNIYGNIAARFFRRPVISTVTGLGDAFLSSAVMSHCVQWLYKISFSNNTTIFFQNNDDYNSMLTANLVQPEQCLLVSGSGVNLDEFRFLPYPRLEVDPTRFLFMGRLLKSKGIEELIIAAGQLKLQYAEQVEIHIIGYYDTDYRQEIEMAQALGKIIYHGFQFDVKKYIEECHCVVLPSYQEGMSNALLEAAAMGRPLIASDICGCREVVEEGKNGFLCEPRSGTALFKAMQKFYLLPTLEKIQMAQFSRQLVEMRFDRKEVVSTMVKSIEDYYN